MRESNEADIKARPDSAEIGQLTEIWRYPVSSLAGEQLSMAHLTCQGVEGDRAYGIFARDDGANIYPVRDSRWNAAPLVSARLVNGRPEIEALREDRAAAADSAEWLAMRRL